MNIFVCVKHAVDESELKVDSAGKPQLQGALSKMSTFDRNAVEEAVRIKESKTGTITVVSLGSGDWKKSIKEALAMGCDRALAVNSAEPLDALSTSYYLSRAIKRLGPFDLVIFSEGASDTYEGLVPPMAAEWLGVPFMGYVRKLEIADGRAKCELALEEQDEVVESTLPVAVSVVSEINSPRYPTLLQVMQASKKPMEDVTLDSLRDAGSPATLARFADVQVVSVSRKKVLFEGPPEDCARSLADSLRKEGLA